MTLQEELAALQRIATFRQENPNEQTCFYWPATVESQQGKSWHFIYGVTAFKTLSLATTYGDDSWGEDAYYIYRICGQAGWRYDEFNHKIYGFWTTVSKYTHDKQAY